MTDAALVATDRTQILQFLIKVRERTRVPGIAVALSVDEEHILVSTGVADVHTKLPLTDATPFEIGCLSKFLTALAVLHLASRNLIDLEARISSYLPELGLGNAARISVRHLLTHSAGYQGEDFTSGELLARCDWEQFAATFSRRVLLFEPGTVYDYSHSASVILGKIVERVTGRSARCLKQESILDPLHIDSSRDAQTSCAAEHIFNGATRNFMRVESRRVCEFWTDSLCAPPLTMGSLSRLGRMLLGGESAFEWATLGRLTRSPLVLPKLFDGALREATPTAIGLGLAEYGTGTYGICSSTPGGTCALRVDPKSKVSMAIAINALQPGTRDFLINKIMSAFAVGGSVMEAPVSAPPPADTFFLHELCGTFQGRVNCSLRASLSNGHLLVLPQPGPGPSQGGRLQPLIFRRTASGEVVPKDQAHPIAMGFFRAPTSRAPCLMVGGSALRHTGTRS